MDEGEFAAPERPQPPDERIILCLELIHSLLGAIHIQPDNHDALSTLLDEFSHITIGGGRLHQLESHLP
jgi:hypothetical protein